MRIATFRMGISWVCDDKKGKHTLDIFRSPEKGNPIEGDI